MCGQMKMHRYPPSRGRSWSSARGLGGEVVIYLLIVIAYKHNLIILLVFKITQVCLNDVNTILGK